jgi:host factor-I protein
MTKERPPSLQDTFLEQLRAQKMPLTIFLANGVKLQGVVASFDGFTVTLVRDGFSQLVYKHAISTLMPSSPLKLFDG